MILSETLKKCYRHQRAIACEPCTAEQDAYIRDCVKAGENSCLYTMLACGSEFVYARAPRYDNGYTCRNIIAGARSFVNIQRPFGGFMKLGECADILIEGHFRKIENDLSRRIQITGGDFCTLCLCLDDAIPIADLFVVQGLTFSLCTHPVVCGGMHYNIECRAIVGDVELQINNDHYIIKENTEVHLSSQKHRQGYRKYVRNLKQKGEQDVDTIAEA